MKKVLFILFTICGLSVWSQDGGAGVKPMIKQIALLKVYISYLEKGYDIARKGLTTIGDIKNGHWQMDTQFFNSLKRVNPKISNYVKAVAITGLQRDILKVCSQLKKMNFNSDETTYINVVISHLLDELENLTGKLVMILTDQRLQLSDDERIQNIDLIYGSMKGQYEFIRNFSNEASILVRQRIKAKKDISVSQKLRGL